MRLTIAARLYILVGIFCIGLAAMAVTFSVKSAANLREQKAEELSSLIDSAINIIKSYDAQVTSGTLTLEDAKGKAAETIRAMRYRGNEYFFVNDYDGVTIMHPIKESLQGKNLIGMKDTNGVLFVAEMINVAKADGAGFVEYTWPKAGSEDPVDKLAYVQGYKSWGWIVGTGVYMDDLSAILWSNTQVMLIIGALIMAICAGVAWITLNAVLNPLNALKNAMSQLANGERLEEVPALDRHDEIGAMAVTVATFKDMTEETSRLSSEQERTQSEQALRQQEIENLIQQFRTEVESELDTVTQNMDRLQTNASNLRELSQSASAQSGQVHGAATTASSNVQTVAASTEEFSASISEIGRQVEQATAAVNVATTSTGKANERVGSLAEAAQQIGEVVSLIQDIAEQTNLLALNATIEAARAGEMGKGFAVVASEVKELANQTSKATDQIGEQVNTIQQSTNEAVQSIEEIGSTIEQVNTFTASIASAVDQQSQATSEIANSIQGAASGTLAVSKDIELVSESVEQTNQAVDEVNTVSGEVSDCASGLAQTVDQFLKRVAAA